MEVRKPEEVFIKLKEVNAPKKTTDLGKRKREEGFRMIHSGKNYTTADIESLPEGERAELIDGELFRMDAPTLTHQDLLMQLSIEIGLYIRKNNGPCRVLPAPFGVYIKEDDRNYVEPDISVICDRNRLDQKGCHGAPDWVIEIMSPSSVQMDRERKVTLYLAAGVREYWIVDSQKETVTIYESGHWDAPAERSFSERIKVGIFEDLHLELSEMDIM